MAGTPTLNGAVLSTVQVTTCKWCMMIDVSSEKASHGPPSINHDRGEIGVW